ncbi:hypothetical protein SK128_024145 [Halocaridina rubra]|uniref:Peptidase C2 calpain large subunit domain-containing protein n=1 Tax=Halocaridina rubra TaxID=373956 RepID=A0AAN8WI28_HALRR
MLMKKFVNARTVTHRMHLKPGKYIIIPCTSKPDKEGEYLLRVFCEKAVSMEENDEDAMVLNVKEDENEIEDEVDGNNEYVPRKNDLKDVFLFHAGEDNKVNATKLQHILNKVFSEVEFSLDLSRGLLALMDRDFSGNMDYYEFNNLVTSLKKWMNIYNIRKDKDTKLLSGRTWGIGDSLKDLGYQIPRRLQGLIVVRYGDDDGNISLRDFLMATSRISVMLGKF